MRKPANEHKRTAQICSAQATSLLTRDVAAGMHLHVAADVTERRAGHGWQGSGFRTRRHGRDLKHIHLSYPSRY